MERRSLVKEAKTGKKEKKNGEYTRMDQESESNSSLLAFAGAASVIGSKTFCICSQFCRETTHYGGYPRCNRSR
jgi:hypothetical protein